MKEFLKKMIISGSGISSKRVAGFTALLIAIILSLLITSGILFFNIVMDVNTVEILKYIYGGLLFFSGASFGLTSFEKFSGNKKEEENK